MCLFSGEKKSEPFVHLGSIPVGHCFITIECQFPNNRKPFQPEHRNTVWTNPNARSGVGIFHSTRRWGKCHLYPITSIVWWGFEGFSCISPEKPKVSVCVCFCGFCVVWLLQFLFPVLFGPSVTVEIFYDFFLFIGLFFITNLIVEIYSLFILIIFS